MGSEKKRLGLIILGLGAQGKRILRHLSALSADVAKLNWELNFVGAIDTDSSAIDRCRAEFPAAFNTAAFRDFSDTNDISSVLTYFTEQAATRQYNACLFYDASPSQLHWQNLRTVIEFDERLREREVLSETFFYYFGEKPILSYSEEDVQAFDRAFSKSLQSYPHWCDFVETKNPAFLEVEKFLDEQNFSVRKMTFWRSSCVGLERYLFSTRKGVTGGSFMDKSIHDLPLVIQLLKHDRVATCMAEVGGHMPLFLSADPSKEDVAMSLAGEAYDPKSILPPAESNASVHLTLNNDAKIVDVALFSSWLGLSRGGRKAINSLVAPFSKSTRDCIASRIVNPVELVTGYAVDEARLLHIAGADRDGRDFAILANLLTRNRDDGWARSLSPWALLKIGDQVSRLPVGDADALMACFKDVIFSVIGISERTERATDYSGLGHASSVAVHKIAKRVRDELSEKFERSGRKLLVHPARQQAMKKLRPPHCFKQS